MHKLQLKTHFQLLPVFNSSRNNRLIGIIKVFDLLILFEVQEIDFHSEMTEI